jgi:hypothetical protein
MFCLYRAFLHRFHGWNFLFNHSTHSTINSRIFAYKTKFTLHTSLPSFSTFCPIYYESQSFVDLPTLSSFPKPGHFLDLLKHQHHYTRIDSQQVTNIEIYTIQSYTSNIPKAKSLGKGGDSKATRSFFLACAWPAKGDHCKDLHRNKSSLESQCAYCSTIEKSKQIVCIAGQNQLKTISYYCYKYGNWRLSTLSPTPAQLSSFTKLCHCHSSHTHTHFNHSHRQVESEQWCRINFHTWRCRPSLSMLHLELKHHLLHLLQLHMPHKIPLV